MPWQSIVPWLAFQAVWLICAIGAARGVSAPGIVAALVFAAAMIAFSRRPSSDALLVGASGILGFAIESALIMAGLVSFSAPWPNEMVAPAWMVALWLAFGASLPSMAAALGNHRLKLAAALGAIAGPLAYLAGARLGALDLGVTPAWSLLVLSAVWAAVMAGLMALHERFRA